MKQGKLILIGLLGLGLVAGVIWMWPRSDAAKADLSSGGAEPAPVAPPSESGSAAVPTPEPVPFVPSDETPPAQDAGLPGASSAGLAGTVEPFGDEVPGGDSADYDEGIAAMVALIQAGRTLDPEAIAQLLNSADPQEQVGGLALLAGLGKLDGAHDYARHPAEVVLAAVDLCGALFDDAAAQALLEAWKARMGGNQPAAEAAHTLLLEVGLSHGGGSTALDLMMGINDNPSIVAGLSDFAFNVELPSGIRTEAFIRLRDQMDPDTHRRFIGDWLTQAREDGEPWLTRAEQLAGLVADTPAESSGPDGAILGRIAAALDQPYPGLVEDIELYLRHEANAGRLALDAESASALRDSIGKLDDASLAGPDLAAWHRLQREIAAWGRTAP